MDATVFTPEWLRDLLLQYEEEVKEETKWPILLLKTSGRATVWRMCGNFGVGLGVPGAACRLLERYLCRHIRSFIETQPEQEEWDQFKEAMMERFYIVASACIMLASKMNEAHTVVTASHVQAALSYYGENPSKSDIVRIEWHVYRTLEFRVPLWSTSETAQFLAWHVQLRSPAMLEAVAILANLLEFSRNQLEEHLRWKVPLSPSIATSSPQYEVFNCAGSLNRSTLHNLHLSAVAVVAATRYMMLQVDVTDELAKLTRCTSLYLTTLAKVMVKEHNHPKPNIIKRRRRV